MQENILLDKGGKMTVFHAIFLLNKDISQLSGMNWDV